MHDRDAPPVTYPVGRSPRLAWALGGLWLAGVAAASGALVSVLARPGQGHAAAAALLASVAVSGLACLAFWRSQRARTLLWDGERWRLEPGDDCGEPARLHARMDLQRALLLSLEQPPARRRTWLWAERARDPLRWHLLRCALYSSAPSAAGEFAAREQRA